jgi:hypothetical protein
MTDKVKLIKEEIKRLYNLYELANDYQRMGACSTILDFIDSLQEESGSEVNFTTKSEDLEEELRKILNKHYYFPDEDDELRSTPELAKYIAHHFAEWQRKKDQETIELAEEHAMLAGMTKEREAMMKDAVEGTVKYEIGSAEIHNSQLLPSRCKCCRLEICR